jgi:GNAT superfamily N-acetyltransferase
LVSFEPLVLRPFRIDDEPAVIELIRVCYLEYGQKIELETLDDDLCRIPARYPWPNTFQVLEDPLSGVVGTVAVKVLNSMEVELKRVFLKSEFRGRGLGKGLTQWAMTYARDNGAGLMHIWSDVLFETAHHLYRGLGAEESGKKRHLGGANDVYEYYFAMALDAIEPRENLG